MPAAKELDTLVAVNNQVVLGTITLDNLIPSIQPILREVIHHDVIGLSCGLLGNPTTVGSTS